MTLSQKTWWAPVWRGLVADPTAKHYRQLDGALWLFIYLVLHADRLTGVVRQRIAAIARATGISPWTPEKNLGRRLISFTHFLT